MMFKGSRGELGAFEDYDRRRESNLLTERLVALEDVRSYCCSISQVKNKMKTLDCGVLRACSRTNAFQAGAPY